MRSAPIDPAKFTDLSDTPSALTAGKYFKVNDAGTAIELVDAPTGGGSGGGLPTGPVGVDSNYVESGDLSTTLVGQANTEVNLNTGTAIGNLTYATFKHHMIIFELGGTG